MKAVDLVERMNGYPMWEELDSDIKSRVCATIRELCELFRQGDHDTRASVTNGLNGNAKCLMFEYSRERAVEVRGTRSRQALVNGLIPVVMAGGRTDTVTGGVLLSMLLRSAEMTGLDVREVFSSAAEIATVDEARTQIREFPLLPKEMNGLARFGITERKTREGIVYELPGERELRPRWWDKLIGRKRPTSEEMLQVFRSLDEYERTKK